MRGMLTYGSLPEVSNRVQSCIRTQANQDLLIDGHQLANSKIDTAFW